MRYFTYTHADVQVFVCATWSKSSCVRRVVAELRLVARSMSMPGIRAVRKMVPFLPEEPLFVLGNSLRLEFTVLSGWKLLYHVPNVTIPARSKADPAKTPMGR